MNKTVLMIGVVVLVGAIVWSVIYSSKSIVDDNKNATSTPVVIVNTVSARPGSPVVITNPVSYPTDTTVIVGGTLNPRGAVTTYWYEYSITATGFENKTPNQLVGSGFNVISAPGYIFGLTKNTLYYFRLVGENQYGRMADTIYSFKTTEGYPAPVGNSPTVKTSAASGVSKTTVNLNGEVTANKAGTQYWFEYGKSTELGNISAFSSAGDGTNKLSVSISLSDLDSFTTYYFRLNAQNQFGTVNGAILNFKTRGPISAKAPSVTTNNATNVTSSGATLNGNINSNMADTVYWFEYSTDSLLGQVLVKNTSSSTIRGGEAEMSVNKVISGLNANTTYHFHVVAENSVGKVWGERQTFKTR